LYSQKTDLTATVARDLETYSGSRKILPVSDLCSLLVLFTLLFPEPGFTCFLRYVGGK
jgi:hypothetical protein